MVVEYEGTPAGQIPVDKDKRCEACDGFGYVNMRQFSSGDKCEDCNMTGLKSPWKEKALCLREIRHVINSRDYGTDMTIGELEVVLKEVKK